jgi:hypothetical protein
MKSEPVEGIFSPAGNTKSSVIGLDQTMRVQPKYGLIISTIKNNSRYDLKRLQNHAN